MKRNYRIEQAVRNYGLAEGISPGVVTLYDPDLWRGPRIMVPIELDALVVTQQDQDQGWANVRFRPENLSGYNQEKANFYGDEAEAAEQDSDDQPTAKGGRVPFDQYDHRDPGVYLHWSLPDGLTQADTISESASESPATETADDKREQSEPEIKENHKFPLIPDRWMVLRFYPGVSPTSKRRVEGWVIRAEEPNSADRVVPLASFREDHGSHGNRWLTAIGEGDPAYVAYYDNVRNQLGFYDGLDRVTRGPLTYLVVGWYSEKGDDPLFGPLTRKEWIEKLDALGWSLGEDDEEIEKRLADSEKAAKARWGKAGVERKYDQHSYAEFYNPKSPIGTSGGMSGVSDRANTEKVNLKSGSQSSNILMGGSTLNADHQESIRMGAGYFNSSIHGLFDASERVAIFNDTDFFRYWPRQILCHGMTYSVRWGDRGGHYDVPGAGKPDPDKVKVCVGNTGVEALSAQIANTTGDRNAERVFNAYHYGMLPELQQQDGLALVESLLHSEDFESRPGGFVTDTIMQGDAFPNLSSSEANRVSWLDDIPAKEKSKTNRDYTLKTKKTVHTKKPAVKRVFSTQKKDISLVRDRQAMAMDPAAFVRVVNSRKPVAVRRAMPRYWEPKDPVVLFSEAKRTYKHGEDEHRTEAGKLLCRMTSETISTVKVNVGRVLTEDVTLINAVYEDIRPSQISKRVVFTGQLPPEVLDLFNETLFLDLDNAVIAAAGYMARKNDGTLAKKFPKQKYTLDDIQEKQFIQRYQVQITLDKNVQLNSDLDAQVIAHFSGKEGRSPAEFAQKPWRRPWIPLHFDWEVEWISSNDRHGDWKLGEHDLETTAQVDAAATKRDGNHYQGTTLLTPAVTRTVYDRLVKFLEDEKHDKQDIATDIQENTLGDINAALDKLDILSGSLAGFHDYLLARVDDFQFDPLVDGNGAALEEKTLDTLEQEKRKLQNLPVYPVRVGHLKLSRLRIVDTFGQLIDLPADSLKDAIKAEDVEADSDTPELIRMPPRINKPSRLMFRMVQADNDQLDATKTISPICGWVLPDHLDEALEVCDAQGNNVGQVQRRRPQAGHIVSSALEWQGVPGDPGSFGMSPDLANAHLQRFVDGILAQGEKDALRAEQEERVETALGAMLRMIDATLWTVDPLGREGDEHLSVLVGRPLAVVRASLRLETMGLEDESELGRMAFDVRLGDLTRLGDGLIGYFVNDDYSQFYPVHESIANQTRVTRPHHGYLGAIQTVRTYYQNYKDRVEPVTHPFINTDPFVRVRPVRPGLIDPASKSVMLTLMVDPRGGVHATSGIVPRKKIELMREHVASALENMSVTFRLGPVLSDPATIRMPLPAEIRGNWSWVRKTGLTVWEETAVVDAVPEPKLTPTPSQINEGWLRLSEYNPEAEKDSGAAT